MGNTIIRNCAFIGIFFLLLMGAVEVKGQEQLDREISGESVSYSYRYETDSYRYEINSDYEEVISFITEEGIYLNTFAGGGSYVIEDAATGIFNVKKSTISYQESKHNGITSLRVDYVLQDGAEAYNLYTFHDKYIEVKAGIKNIARYDTVAGALLKRDMLSQYTQTEKKLATSWVYPEDGDFPYKTADSIVTTYLFEDEYKLYSFVRGKDGNRNILFEEYDETDIPIAIDEEGLKSYEIEYDLVFESTKNERDADYFALFEGKDSEFAARIQILEQNGSNVAIYDTDELTLNLNVTNLLTEPINTEVTYTVYAYDGEVICGEEAEIRLDGEQGQNIPVYVETEKNGMFYLDFQVKSGHNSYREFFSFALIEPYEYRHTGDNPFGLSGVRFGKYEPNDDTVWIMDRLGISNARICFSEGDYVEKDYTLLNRYLEKMYEQGIKMDGQYLLLSGWRIPTEETLDEFESAMAQAIGEVGKYLDSCEVGNEYNLFAQNQSISQAMNDYMKIYFEPGYRQIKQKYDIAIAGAGVGLSKTDWLEESVRSGMFAKQDILKTHAYGFPYSPDYTDDPSLDLVVESAFARVRAFLDKYGDKTWYVDEIGYPTTANVKAGIGSGSSLRSQADYLVRALTLGLSYGADRMAVYNLYDQRNLFKGVSDTDMEFNFGIFYYPDYYGRILPKPSAIAIKNMTELLDGVETCQEIETESDTTRAFELFDKNNTMISCVAWSNGSRLSNDTADTFTRTPNLPWQNQWEETETVRFYVTGDEVEVIDIMGNVEVLPITDGYVDIELDGSPRYIQTKSVR